MTVSNINNSLFTALSALDGITLSTLTAVDGQTIDAGSGIFSGKLFNRFYWNGFNQEPAVREVDINVADSLTAGLVFLAFPGGCRWLDVISGGKATTNSASLWFNTGAGPSGTFPATRYSYGQGATGGEYIAYPFSPELGSITTQCTIAVWLSVSDLLNAYAGLISIPYAGGVWVAPFAAMDFVRSNNTSAMQFSYVNAGSQVAVTSDTGIIAADNVLRLYSVTRDGATVTFYKDGFQSGAQKTLASSANTDFNGGQPITIGNRSSTTNGNQMGGSFAMVALWNRVLSPSEMALLYLKPLALVKPPY